MSHAGGVLLGETVRAAGVAEVLSVALASWRPLGGRHAPSKVLVDRAVAVVRGGDCWVDVAVVRARPAVSGPVAALAGAARRADPVLAAINDARALAGERVGRLAGDRSPDHQVTPAPPRLVEVDGVLVEAPAAHEQAAPTLTKGCGHHRLSAFVDQGSQGPGAGRDAARRRERRGAHRR